MAALNGQIDAKDKEIMDLVDSFFDTNFRAPSTREVEEYTGISHQTVQRRLLKLSEQNELRYDGKLNVIITPHMEEQQERGANVVQLSIIGRIACGTPEEEVECRLGTIDFPRALLGIGDYFILEAAGDSMTGIGIESGDLIVCKRTCEADPGDVVIAMNDNKETTLKTLKFDLKQQRYYLHPEAPGYSDIYPDEIDIIGIATKIIKNI